MATSLRAALSLALLAGFYLYAVIVTVLIAGLGMALAAAIGIAQVAVLPVVASLAIAGSVLYATWKVARAQPRPLGLPMDERQAPVLWQMARELAAEVGTRPPDEIRLVAEVNASVTERTRLLGLVGGERHLHIGLPLLQGLTVAQLRFVLAHELGHYSHHHLRLGASVYRGRSVILQTIGYLGRMRGSEGTFTAAGRWLLQLYAGFYLDVSAAVSRVQEVEADRAAAWLAGQQSGITALHELGVLDTAWQFYLDNYIGDLRGIALAPAGVLADFPSLLAGRSEELAKARSRPPASVTSRWDSHPSTAERIFQLLKEPVPAQSIDDRPAGVLVVDLTAATAELERVALDFGDRQLVPFAEFTAGVVHHDKQAHADTLFRAVSRRTGGPADLAVVLELFTAGRAADLARLLVPPAAAYDLPTAMEALTEAVASAIAVAAVRSGVAQWRHSWSEPATLRDRAGETFGQGDLAARAVGGEADKVREALEAMGIDLAAANAAQTTASLATAEAYAALLNVPVNGTKRDVVITTHGLITVPALRFYQQWRVLKRMLTYLREVPPAEIAAQPGCRFLPYEEIAAAQVMRKIPLKVTFQLHSGEQVTLRQSFRTGELANGWDALREITAQHQGMVPPRAGGGQR